MYKLAMFMYIEFDPNAVHCGIFLSADLDVPISDVQVNFDVVLLCAKL